jgi:trans-AT polyketide synthase/acyltransferase/oxidoreductase domain-containing protein
MGADLFDNFPELTAKADEILGYSIKELCLQDPREQLTQTQFTQLALFVVNALTYHSTVKQSGRKPDFVAGHSLGEYDALLAAEAFDFASGLQLVKKRGELMSQMADGGMAAVIGLDREGVNRVLAANGLDTLDIANYNSPTQTTVSGPKADIERAQPFFDAAGVRKYLVLNVSGAFHSRLMTKAAGDFAKYLEQFEFRPLTIPVISNVHARPYYPGEVKENLVKQLTSPVRWVESVTYLLDQGVEQIDEIGPGEVLKGLVKTIRDRYQPRTSPIVVQSENRAASNAAAATAAGSSPAATLERPLTSVTKADRAEPFAASLTAEFLGDPAFRRDYNIKYAYVTGGMYHGIASKDMVVKVGKAGLMGFFGTGGLRPGAVEEAIRQIQGELNHGEAYGVNLISDLIDPQTEEEIVALLLKYKVRNLEAGAFMSITPALVRFRLQGLRRSATNQVESTSRIIAKVSRPEVAQAFLSPAPERIVEKLLAEGKVTQEQAALARSFPMADDLVAEADSAGYTDHGVAFALYPSIVQIRDEMMKKFGYRRKVRVGAAGGLGTPAALAAAFLMGADFVLTGSVNQCTVEAGTSSAVKDLLQDMDIQDTEYAPAGSMLELGAKVQVLRKGVLFPARAKKLYDLYQQYNSLDEIEETVRKRLEERYFRRTLEQVYSEVKAHYSTREISKAEQNPKHKMALVFKWYFAQATDFALSGNVERKVDYQVHCGPALGAFNRWVRGTKLEDWRNRHVDDIAGRLMVGAAEFLSRRCRELAGSDPA